MSKRSFRTALGIVLGTVLVLGGVGLYMANRALSYPGEHHDGVADEIPVSIDHGMTFPQIAQRLADEGVIDKPRWFRLYAMHRGDTTKVRSGNYMLRGNMTPEQVLDQLLEGVKEKNVSITIAEGLHMLDIFKLLEGKQIASAHELEKLARDPEFLEAHGIEGENIDGYLFPETYRFRVPTAPANVLERMIRQHRSVWADIRKRKAREIAALRDKLGWSERDIVIMASIVEKEAVVDSERPRIAQVFINRLVSPTFKPHRLDTDPTIRYGCQVPRNLSAACKDWDLGRLRRRHLNDKDNPYNTYQHEGLPPGPICNPGRKSLEATVQPDRSKYLFFVSRNNGTHVFARTRREHERNVDKFQR